jgi:hypothetical protein
LKGDRFRESNEVEEGFLRRAVVTGGRISPKWLTELTVLRLHLAVAFVYYKSQQ